MQYFLISLFVYCILFTISQFVFLVTVSEGKRLAPRSTLYTFGYTETLLLVSVYVTSTTVWLFVTSVHAVWRADRAVLVCFFLHALFRQLRLPRFCFLVIVASVWCLRYCCQAGSVCCSTTCLLSKLQQQQQQQQHKVYLAKVSRFVVKRNNGNSSLQGVLRAFWILLGVERAQKNKKKLALRIECQTAKKGFSTS